VANEPQPALAGALDTLWARFQPEMNQRVAALESAAKAFEEDDLSAEEQEEAHAAAHKLAGVLGTFGLTRGTVLARELEMMYSRESRPERASAPRLAGIAAELRTIVASRK
jgi:HPt (histidine-containing phosphotransfer) domain-containing protein